MNTAPDRPYALVRRLADTLADGIVTFLERMPVDVELAKRQWDDYVAALERSGWPTVVIDGDDSMPDSVFVEDTVVMFGDLAVVTNPRQPTRNPETAAVRRRLGELGLDATSITEGTLDGGDVLKIGSQVYVGLSGTTTVPAADQLARILAPRGYTVTTVPLTKALHLKSAITALPDGTVIGYEPVVDDPGLFPTFLAVPESRRILRRLRDMLNFTEERNASSVKDLRMGRPTLATVTLLKGQLFVPIRWCAS